MADRKNIAQERPRAHHILSFAQGFAGGGVEAALLRLSAGWVAAGRRVTILVGSAEGPLAESVPPGVALQVIGDARYTALLAAAPRVVRALAPDVVFCPGNHYTSIAAWIRLRLGVGCPPIVGKVSNALVRPDMGWIAPGYAAWLRLHPRFLDAAVAMTPGTARETVAAMRMPPQRVHVIANPAVDPVADGPPLLPGRYLVGVGRLQPQKRWDRAVAALARLPGAQLAILGEGPLRDALTAQADTLDVAERLYLPGHVADPLPAIRHAAALVLTSQFEGVPGVVREALSVGTPVVATDSTVALAELIPDARFGTIVPQDDPAALVAALAERLRPNALRPAPVIATGDPAADYASLFDSLLSSSS